MLSRRWTAKLPDCAAVARRAAMAALASGPAQGAVELSIALAGDRLARRLNREFRGQDKPTNVLSFAGDAASGAARQPRLLGDVVLAFETVQGEAKEQKKPFADHLSHLVVHGVLHLLGHDHARNAEAAAMERLERTILAKLGVPDPYRACLQSAAVRRREARAEVRARP
ncbi:MAG: rRNA maturation RNase YbeY [Proteobacteria bacterium]|nr:rRNA maturation RNase YbeY [Pseudomonadota bacterium]MBI3499038.1 rRNA maturation RNase YbeY [Pseudomonadota bacterium]